MTATPWGPSGQTVYERTYSRPKPDGTHETWPETVSRVAHGNLALVYGDDMLEWSPAVVAEYVELTNMIHDFKLLPAGRHLWASGVKGRQFLMNCWTSGWTEKLSDHFEFTFMRLMEGGGVGANYSSHFLEQFGLPRRGLNVHIVCDRSHPDYQEMRDAGVLSYTYDSDWSGAFEVEDSREGWAAALVDLIDTYMTDEEVKHFNRVYDVTNVRAKGARLKTFGGTASGPQPFGVMMREVARVLNLQDTTEESSGAGHLTPIEAMEIDHAIAECVVSGGVRRSARMSIVRWDDPAIFDFIACKADGSKHWTTNISVEIDDEFLECLNVEKWQPNQYLAVAVHEAVVKGMLANGEPGYWNSSLSNKGELEPVYATNPCGEICLHAWEPCCLAHVNLDAFAPKTAGSLPDYGGMGRAHELATRFAIRATYADIVDDKSRDITNMNRRIGIGHLGVQGFLVKSGYRYSDVGARESSPGYHLFRNLLVGLKGTVRETARKYAFELRIPEPVKVTTVAPTGSISKLPGVPEGIHPIYARFFEQRIRFNVTDVRQAEAVRDASNAGYLVELDVYDQSGSTYVVVYPTKNILVEQVEALGFPVELVEQADEISLDDALAFQAMYQSCYADNAVSYTVNVPEGLDPSVVSASLTTWLPRLKGTTIMVDGTREQAPLTRITEAEYLAGLTEEGDVVGDDIDLDCATGACPIR